MYAVIFKAEINALDENYTKTAKRMRDLAMQQYGCTRFVSLMEGSQELTVSYWESPDQIEAWKQDPEHQKAQELGRSLWYRSYSVDVVHVLRHYGTEASD